MVSDPLERTHITSKGWSQLRNRDQTSTPLKKSGRFAPCNWFSASLPLLLANPCPWQRGTEKLKDDVATFPSLSKSILGWEVPLTQSCRNAVHTLLNCSKEYGSITFQGVWSEEAHGIHSLRKKKSRTNFWNSFTQIINAVVSADQPRGMAWEGRNKKQHLGRA